MNDRQKWTLVATAAGAFGAFAVRNGLEKAWKVAHAGEDPPKNPASWDVSWRDAILWTVATGVVIGLGRLIAERSAATAWNRFTGQLPPV